MSPFSPLIHSPPQVVFLKSPLTLEFRILKVNKMRIFFISLSPSLCRGQLLNFEQDTGKLVFSWLLYKEVTWQVFQPTIFHTSAFVPNLVWNNRLILTSSLGSSNKKLVEAMNFHLHVVHRVLQWLTECPAMNMSPLGVLKGENLGSHYVVQVEIHW